MSLINKMNKKNSMILAVKSAPDEDIFSSAREAGIGALEIYLSKGIFKDLKAIMKLCSKFSFQYAIHAPNDSYEPEKLAELSKAIKAEVVVFHNIYWDDEWDKVDKIFKGLKTRVCIENIFSIHEAVKFERRYEFGRCLDLEHLQMECGGVFEEEFINAIKRASHIHLTGYTFGSCLWHTHFHHNLTHGIYMLELLKKAGYSGFVVSEAKVTLQNKAEFMKLAKFYGTYYKDGK